MAITEPPGVAFLSADDGDEYYFHEGCHILELSNGDHDPQLSIARARVPPGISTRRHSLVGLTERYLVLSGRGEVSIGERSRPVAAGSVVVIPPGCPQSIRNTGEGDLVFLALCTPRFRPDCYRALEPAAG